MLPSMVGDTFAVSGRKVRTSRSSRSPSRFSSARGHRERGVARRLAAPPGAPAQPQVEVVVLLAGPQATPKRSPRRVQRLRRGRRTRPQTRSRCSTRGRRPGRNAYPSWRRGAARIASAGSGEVVPPRRVEAHGQSCQPRGAHLCLSHRRRRSRAAAVERESVETQRWRRRCGGARRAGGEGGPCAKLGHGSRAQPPPPPPGMLLPACRRRRHAAGRPRPAAAAGAASGAVDSCAAAAAGWRAAAATGRHAPRPTRAAAPAVRSPAAAAVRPRRARRRPRRASRRDEAARVPDEGGCPAGGRVEAHGRAPVPAAPLPPGDPAAGGVSLPAELHTVLRAIREGRLLQCRCGVRFGGADGREARRAHMDFHFRRNRRATKTGVAPRGGGGGPRRRGSRWTLSPRWRSRRRAPPPCRSSTPSRPAAARRPPRPTRPRRVSRRCPSSARPRT